MHPTKTLHRDYLSIVYFLLLALVALYQLAFENAYFSALLVAPLFYMLIISGIISVLSATIELGDSIIDFIQNLPGFSGRRRKLSDEGLMYNYGFLSAFMMFGGAVALFLLLDESGRGELLGWASFFLLVISLIQILISTFPFPLLGRGFAEVVRTWADRTSKIGATSGVIAIIILISSYPTTQLFFGEADWGAEPFLLLALLFSLFCVFEFFSYAGKTPMKGLAILYKEKAPRRWPIWLTALATLLITLLVWVPKGSLVELSSGNKFALVAVSLTYFGLAVFHYQWLLKED